MSDSPNVTRKLAAIMFTDIVGFTKIMADSEDAAFNILKNQDDIVNPLMTKFNGNLIKKMGDGLLVEFPSTVEAVECATQIQESIKTYNSSNDNIEFHIRIGIHLGDIVILGDDILGDGVNIASRIEPLASPDGICITDAVYQSVKSKLKLDAERIDEVDLKHIDDKYIIYKLPREESIDDKAHQKNEINITRFEINSIDNETKLFQAIKKIFLFVFMCVFLGFLFGHFVGNFTLNSLLTFSLRKGIIGVVASVIIAFPIAFFQSKRKYKLNFQDIRNVSSLLDILIIKMQFNLVKQTGNSIEYIHMPVTDIFINKIKLTKYYPKILRSFETFRLTFDGNTVKLVGMAFFMFRLLRSLKKYSKK